MALETQTISTAEIKPIFAFDLDASQALGTAHEAADDYYDFQVISFSMPYDSTALEVAPDRLGHYAQIESQGRHRRDLNTWTFDVSMMGTENAVLANCHWAFGDGASICSLTPALGMGTGTNHVMQMKHGTGYNNHTSVIFQNGGTDNTADDLVVRGCLVESMTFKQDVGANAGQLTIDTTLWTAYPPTEAASTIALDTSDDDTPYSIFNLTSAVISLGGQELVCSSWEITISRPLERNGSQDYSSYLPFSVGQTGAWEVTGSVTVKADDNTYDLISKMQGDSAGIALTIAGTGFSFSCPDVMIDAAAIDNGGSALNHTIPFRAFAASKTASVIDITAT